MEPPTVEPSAKEGLINVRDFSIKGEAALDRVAAGGPAGAQNGVSFSALRAEFTRQNGQLTIRDGVVKGPIDRRDHRRQHRLSSAIRCA